MTTSAEMLEDLILSKYSFRTNEQALREYLHFEYTFLSQNTSLNPHKFNSNSKLLLSSLENYFNLPMIITRSVFSAFDKGNKNYLTKDEYINGFVALYNGSIDIRIRMLFDIFNVNNDNFVHIEDVRCILTYAHVFYNKVNSDILEQTIATFFGRHRVFTFEEFKRRVYTKQSGLFLIMLILFFEHKSFDNDVISLLEDSEKYGSLSPENDDVRNSPALMKKNMQIKNANMKCPSGVFGSSASKKNGVNVVVNANSNTNNDKYIAGCSTAAESAMFPRYQSNVIQNTKQTINDNDNNTGIQQQDALMPFPTADVIQYIINNFGFDINNANANNVNATNNTNINDIDGDNDNNNQSFISDHSLIEDDPEAESDLDFLFQFEYDYVEIKQRADFIGKFMNNGQFEYAIPRGSNDFEIKSGLICSKLNSSNKKRSMSSTKSFNVKIFNNSKPSSNYTKGGNFNKDKSKKHYSSNALIVINNKNRDSILQTSISDYMQPQQSSSAMECTVHQDTFEEDVYMLHKKTNSLKKYTLLLIKTAVFVIKKKHFELQHNNNKQKEDYNSLGAKLFIPTKRLYISSVDYHYQHENKEYIQLVLVSTVFFKRKMYNFLFDNKHHVNIFVTLFAKITKYISIENEYTYIKDIGKGSFCQMKLARHNSTGLLYAIKKIKKDVGSPEEFTTLNWEKDIVHFLKHLPCTKHILKCYNTIETLDHLYILTEYIAGGSLSSFIRKNNVCLPSSTVKEIIMQVTSGVAVLHSYGIVHRDLKLENILMDYLDMQTFTAKIIDFGLSQVITPLSKTKETYGTLIYCSPEILLNVPYNYKVDVWSLGVISYYLEYTFMPFGIRGKEAEQEISNKIIMSELKFPRKVDSRNDQNEIKANKQITMVIKRCLTRDINQRLTTAQMLSYLMDSGSK